MKDLIPISAVVLAAGTSSRMEDFKPLLPIDGKPMFEQVVTKVLSFPFIEVLAVVGYRAEELKESINLRDQRFKWVDNLNYIEGLSSSLKAAIHQCNPESQGIMVFLGDQPLVLNSTVDLILQVIKEKGYNQSKCIVQPTYNGKRGHPVYISSQMIPQLQTLTGDQGAKPIFKFADRHIQIPIDDKGIIFDVDTQQDYQKLMSEK